MEPPSHLVTGRKPLKKRVKLIFFLMTGVIAASWHEPLLPVFSDGFPFTCQSQSRGTEGVAVPPWDTGEQPATPPPLGRQHRCPWFLGLETQTQSLTPLAGLVLRPSGLDWACTTDFLCVRLQMSDRALPRPRGRADLSPEEVPRATPRSSVKGRCFCLWGSDDDTSDLMTKPFLWLCTYLFGSVSPENPG